MKGLTFYTDGSCRGNPGFGGSGIFGYLYEIVEKKKIYKHPVKNLYFTREGFSLEKPNENLEVHKIIELIKSSDTDKNTNNATELEAILFAIDISEKYLNEISEVLIITDSNYVVNCFYESLDRWKNNNWRRIDNKEIIHLDAWLKIYEFKNKLENSGKILKFKWIKGHSGEYGNELADLYASVGSNANALNKYGIIYYNESDYKSYKNSFVYKDFVFYFRDILFSSIENDDTYQCFLNSSNDEHMLGKKNNSSIYALNIGFVPSIINKIRDSFRKIPRDYVATCCIKLSKFQNKEVIRLANLIDVDYLLVRNNHNAFSLIGDNTDFVFECGANYPFIVNAISLYKTMLEVVSNKDQYLVIDVTHYFLDDKNKLKITNKNKVFDFTDVINNYEVYKDLVTFQGSATLDTLKKTLKSVQRFRLMVDRDIPTYLSLKSLEGDIEALKLILTLEDNYVTVYFYIKTNNREIITCNIKNKYIRLI